MQAAAVHCGDGIVNLKDVISALQVMTGQTPDTNGDGRIGIEEAIIIIRKISGC